MLMLAFLLFVALPLGGALVIGTILFFERLAGRTPAREQGAPAAPGPQQGLAARVSQPALQCSAPSAWEAITSGSHLRVAMRR